jgi:hypothetical protein
VHGSPEATRGPAARARGITDRVPRRRQGEPWRGGTSGGQRPRQVFGPTRCGLSGGIKALEPEPASSASRREGRAERQESRRPRERCGSPGRSEALKAEPQERYRDETSPDGVAGWKPARACETLRPEGGGRGKPADRAKARRTRRKARTDRTRGSSCAEEEGSPGGCGSGAAGGRGSDRRPRRRTPASYSGACPEGAREATRGESRSTVRDPRCGREDRNAAETACRER